MKTEPNNQYSTTSLLSVNTISLQKYACRDKTFVATKLCFCVCSDKSYPYFCPIFLSQQKTCFVMTATCFCREKSKLVTTKLLSLQNYVCRDKYLLRQKFCCDRNMFFATNVLSRQAYFCHDKRRVPSRQTRVCRNKTFLSRQKMMAVSGCRQ